MHAAVKVPISRSGVQQQQPPPPQPQPQPQQQQLLQQEGEPEGVASPLHVVAVDEFTAKEIVDSFSDADTAWLEWNQTHPGGQTR